MGNNKIFFFIIVFFLAIYTTYKGGVMKNNSIKKERLFIEDFLSLAGDKLIDVENYSQNRSLVIYTLKNETGDFILYQESLAKMKYQKLDRNGLDFCFEQQYVGLFFEKNNIKLRFVYPSSRCQSNP